MEISEDNQKQLLFIQLCLKKVMIFLLALQVMNYWLQYIMQPKLKNHTSILDIARIIEDGESQKYCITENIGFY